MTNKISTLQLEIVRLYVDERVSTKYIASKLNINVKTVIVVLRKNNIEIRKSKKNLLGNKYFRLSVLKFTKNDNSKKPMWECLCDCKNVVEVRGSDLISGKVKSCGCYHSEISRENIKLANKKYPKSCNFKGIGDISGGYLSQVKHNAFVRKLEYSLSKEYLWELFLKQNRKCALTGLEIWFGISNKEKRFGKKEQTASIDRIDSNGGYVENNVQWVHKDINNIKQDYTVDEFVNYCKLVVENYEKFIKKY